MEEEEEEEAREGMGQGWGRSGRRAAGGHWESKDTLGSAGGELGEMGEDWCGTERK